MHLKLFKHTRFNCSPLGYNNSVNLQPNTSVLVVAVVSVSVSVIVSPLFIAPPTYCTLTSLGYALFSAFADGRVATMCSHTCSHGRALFLLFALHSLRAERHSHTTTYLTHTHSALSAFCVRLWLWPFFRAQLPPSQCDRAAAESVVCVGVCAAAAVAADAAVDAAAQIRSSVFILKVEFFTFANFCLVSVALTTSCRTFVLHLVLNSSSCQANLTLRCAPNVIIVACSSLQM